MAGAKRERVGTKSRVAADEATRAEMTGLFRRMMALEEAFFDAAFAAD